jgi:hypothetical protein
MCIGIAAEKVEPDPVHLCQPTTQMVDEPERDNTVHEVSTKIALKPVLGATRQESLSAGVFLTVQFIKALVGNIGI